MPDSESTQKMLQRFEQSMEYTESKPQDSDDVLRKFRFWQERSVSPKQQQALIRLCEKKDIPISYRAKRIRYKPIGISERKGIPREKLKKRYEAIKHKTKKGYVRRIHARDSKGRFTKK